MSNVLCGECGQPMVLRRNHFDDTAFYGCSRFPQCKGTHGAHPNGDPLGIPANKETKQWRIKAHDAFDRMWKHRQTKNRKAARRRRLSRRKAYEWLEEMTGIAHIAEADIDGCQRIIAACREREGLKDG